MFKRSHSRRSSNPLFVIFRLILSLVMFGVLIGGVYSAYKHFSGLDPLKIDPQAVVSEILDKIPGIKGKQLAVPNLVKEGPSKEIKSEKTAFKFLLVADSHNDNANLRKAILQAKQAFPDLNFIIGLGDYTDVGTIQELKLAKKEFDQAHLRYFLTAGDHDLWDSRDKQIDPQTNFRQVFGPTYQSFTYQNFTIIILYNSDNYLGLGDEQTKWLTNELEKAKQSSGIFVFAHEPLFHPSSDHFMGRVEKDLKMQAKSITYQLKESRLPDGQAGVKKVFAGDIHYFSEYEEPETKLSMVTVGALVTERNPQSPRYGIVTVFEDGSTKIDDVEVK